MPSSSVLIRIPGKPDPLRFSGVTQLRHAFTAKLNVDPEASGTEVVNGAKNQPNKLTLSVVESDVGHPAGWCRRMLDSLETLKQDRQPVTVETTLHTYESMLLSDLTVIQDERTGDGFIATLIFTELTATSTEDAAGSSGRGSSGGRSPGLFNNSSEIVYRGLTVDTNRILVLSPQPTAEDLRLYIQQHQAT